MSNNILEVLQTLIQSPNLASKKWIYQQYDSQVMNDTIYTKGDAAIVRIHNTKKAIAISTDCTPRYVEADAFEGSIQAVAETYRNISAVGAKPMAITNCLNFGNPQKPEIMGQIVRSIKGINEACIALDYPVVSGNVSLYNETDGKSIKPTPAIGGVGLIKDFNARSSLDFKFENDEIFVIGSTNAHIACSLYEKEILKIDSKSNPPKVDLKIEKKHGEFVRSLILKGLINACHDISDGGLLVALFEMTTKDLGCSINISELNPQSLEHEEKILFSEDQSRYIVSIDSTLSSSLKKIAKENDVEIFKIGNVIKNKLIFSSNIDSKSFTVETKDLIKVNEEFLEKKFS